MTNCDCKIPAPDQGSDPYNEMMRLRNILKHYKSRINSLNTFIVEQGKKINRLEKCLAMEDHHK